MPVKIGSFEPLSEEEFTALRQQKARKTDPAMVALLAEVATGHPVRVPLVEGQSARGLRTAISRAATSRGLTRGDGRRRGLRRGTEGRRAASEEADAANGRAREAAGTATESDRTTRWTRSLRQRTTSGSSRDR